MSHEEIVERLTVLGEQVEVLEEERKRLRLALADDLDPGSYVIAGCKVSVTAPKRMTAADKAKFENDYPVAGFPAFYKTDLDLVEIKLSLAPNQLAEYQTVGAKQVRVT